MDAAPVRRVAVVGAGITCASRAVRCLAAGLDVVATPAPDVDDELAGIDRLAMVGERDDLLEQLIALKADAEYLPGSAR